MRYQVNLRGEAKALKWINPIPMPTCTATAMRYQRLSAEHQHPSHMIAQTINVQGNDQSIMLTITMSTEQHT